MPESVMIFAAGFGTRMMPLTKNAPKPMVEVGGVPLIDRATQIAHDANATNIVINTHYKAHVLSDHLKNSDIQIVHERHKILDTGGGLKNALPLLGSEPVWTFNPDVIWLGPNPMTHVSKHWNPDKMDALLLCVDITNTIERKGGGDFSIHPDGQLSRGGSMVYGGIQILKTGPLKQIEQDAFSLNLLWDVYARSNRLFGCSYPGTWCDVGTPQAKETAETLLETPVDG